MLTTIWAIARKDLKVFFADRRAMMMTFLVPIIIATFFGLIFSGGGSGNKPTTKLQVAFADLDKSKLTQDILADLKKSDSVTPVEMDRDDLIEAVKKGERSVGIVFPKGFGEMSQKAMFYGDKPKLQLFYDPSKSFEKQIVNGALMETVMSKVSQAAMNSEGAIDNFQQGIDALSDPKQKAALTAMRNDWKAFQTAQKNEPSATSTKEDDKGGMRTPFDMDEQPLTAGKGAEAEKAATVGHVFAGMAVQGILFFGIEAAMSLLREKRVGLWSRLRAAPVSLASLLLGRGLGSWIIGCAVITGVFLFGMLVLGLRIQGSWLGMLLVVLTTGLMTATFGLLVASLGKTEAQSRGLAILAVLSMSMLGGAWFPTFLMPEWLQKVSLAIPVRWAVDGFDAMTWRGSGLSEALLPCLGLLGFSVVFATIASLRYQKNAA